ncbi:hypothetical protein SAY87_026215 [Trapa incisa]|uniref:Uncharacterized protein n=1 Tax=Trapa incisa TaxID=236973 RepID=A0AAN7GLS1_9MYRT|nr:hypothetical protein SAY87_026215 [Trapa incisa]
MSTQAVKTPPLRVFWCRRMELNLDLNTPPIENQDQEGTSNQDISQQMVKNKSQTNHGRACIVDVDSGEEMTSGQKRRRGPAGEPLIEFYDLINLEGSRSSLANLSDYWFPGSFPLDGMLKRAL